MTKKDIAKGDIVLLRNGKVCVVWKDMDDPNKGLTLYGKIYSPCSFLKPSPSISISKIIHLYDYYDSLTSSDDGSFDDYDIMAVRKTSDCGLRYSVPFIFDALFYSEKYERDIIWDWKREEIKEVTMAEVEEKFGCKVKIVKENEDG